MTKQEKEEVMDMPTVAVSFGLAGFEIKKIEYGIDDYIIFVASGNSVHRCKVYYTTYGPYFKYHGYRIPLDECMRC